MNMTEKENEMIVQADDLPEPDREKKGGLVRGTRDFIENTVATLKGKDLNKAVEEFTGEMTLVAEGLSEDQAKLRQDLDKTDAQLTLAQENALRLDTERRTEIRSLGDSVKQAQKRAESMEKRLEDLEKNVKELASKPRRAGLGQILRQATWMVGILCAAWVIVTILKMVGR